MLNFKEFIEKALEENGVQNDEKDVWVEVEGEQYTTSVESVLEREEQEPFEASYALENNLEHEAWEELYDSYKENYKADKGGRKMKTLSYINGKEQEIKIGAELYFGQIWDGEDGYGEQLLEDGCVSPDGENVVAFEIIDEDENDILDTLVIVTDIY